jgi:hypothetical protein
MAITFSKKQLITISFILAMFFHFSFYFNEYGPSVSILKGFYIYWLALGSVAILLFIYFGTYWRVDLKGNRDRIAFDLLIIWIGISILRSVVELKSLGQIRLFLFNTYLGLSMLPVLFFIVGINIRYFFTINRLLTIYLFVVTPFSLLFIDFFELQLFLLYPIFYIILTIPMRNSWDKFLVVIISVTIAMVSLTNRAGIIRILISYCILGAYLVMTNLNINKKLIKFIVFCLLMIPVVSLVLGISGVSVFQLLLGSDTIDYSQMNPYADTRTFLYFEVFQDLKYNNAFLFGKGMDAGYSSLAFETYSRTMVEVGFLQILMKTGIVGFALYAYVVVSAIFKALGKANNLFIKAIGLLLASYLLLIFIENVVAYNLLNVVIWIIVGMCHSPVLRSYSDGEIKNMFRSGKLREAVKV